MRRITLDDIRVHLSKNWRRIKSVLRRRAKQLAAKRSRELSLGSLADLEQMYSGRAEIEQRVYANELLAHLCRESFALQCSREYDGGSVGGTAGG